MPVPDRTCATPPTQWLGAHASTGSALEAQRWQHGSHQARERAVPRGLREDTDVRVVAYIEVVDCAHVLRIGHGRVAVQKRVVCDAQAYEPSGVREAGRCKLAEQVHGLQVQTAHRRARADEATQRRGEGNRPNIAGHDDVLRCHHAGVEAHGAARGVVGNAIAAKVERDYGRQLENGRREVSEAAVRRVQDLQRRPAAVGDAAREGVVRNADTDGVAPPADGAGQRAVEAGVAKLHCGVCARV
jgi:hypothetical protein